MSSDTWQLLPSSLRELHMGEHIGVDGDDHELPTDGFECNNQILRGMQLPNLRELEYMGNHIPLRLLASFLRLAPKLEQIPINDVWVPCTPNQIPDLKLVHSRLSAGLTVISAEEQRMTAGMRGEGIMLALRGLQDTDFGQAAANFVSRLPPFDLFRNVGVANCPQPLLPNLARVFPKLRMLVLLGSERLDGISLPSLAGFSSLQIVDVCFGAEKFSALELGVLCMKVPLLRLGLRSCYSGRSSLIAVLQAWGSPVVVGHR